MSRGSRTIASRESWVDATEAGESEESVSACDSEEPWSSTSRTPVEREMSVAVNGDPAEGLGAGAIRDNASGTSTKGCDGTRMASERSAQPGKTGSV